ncbi:MAG: hypothetical protein J6A22_08215 [Bacteroidales bacterium]|nr:hypothetical protein [Bacteroidales bacterium]
MARQTEERDVYRIPENFVDTGTVMGGMFKLRNVLEAGAIAAVFNLPLFKINISLTAKIIIACLTALPLGLLALIGVNGESLTSFILGFFKFLQNKRVIGKGGTVKTKPEPKQAKPKKAKEHREEPVDRYDDFDDEFHDDFSRPKKEHPVRRTFDDEPHEKKKTIEFPKPTSPVAQYLPIEDIRNGIIYTRDHRYVKIIEVSPINFLLRSAREQRNIIYSFVSYLKISPAKIQFKVLTKKADVNRHLYKIEEEIAHETDEKCRVLQQDYANLVRQLGSKEAITRRFFLIFEYEGIGGRRGDEKDALAELNSVVQTATVFLRQCGNEVIQYENDNDFTVDVLYNLLNRNTAIDKTIEEHIADLMTRHVNMEQLPVGDIIAPDSIDVTHGSYVLMDRMYHAYLLIPSDGYKDQVSAGWLSLLVNAGEGIDLDIFIARQPKEQMVRKIGQQLRINRSKIKDASDTNTDFDDLDSAIRSGYYLKDGLGNNEDLYFMNILITVTADSEKELEWRIDELKKLLISQDIEVSHCHFREEQAFLSALPLVSLDKHLFARSKRNILTTGVASCYPFTSFEMCDDNGILLGVNKHNNSLIIVDIFNSHIYKNANMAILGTSGSGKTFTMQLMALRMRRKNIQTFIIAPLKGNEFYRACNNIGGEFIQISPASPNCINIMEIRKTDTTVADLLDAPNIDKSMLAGKIQKLHIFFSLLIPDMTYEEKQLLDDALIKTYAMKGITHNNDTLVNPEHPEQYKEMPILGDLHEVLKQSPETKRLANIINRFVGGSARSFNQQTNVRLDNKYIVLDISELTGDLLTVGMFVALDYVWDKAKEDRTAEKAIFVDETWQLIGAASNRLAAEFVLEIFKIIRGYGGSAICATQDLNDFFALEDGKYGKGIINNAKTKIVLNLEDEEAQRVQDILHLSETETMAITHFERGNGLISTNNNNITVEFKASELEKELITTDRRELKEIVDRARQQVDYESST